MFDNSDPYDLKEIGLYAVNRENAEQAVYSEALWERKGLLIAPEKNLIGVPVNVCDFDENISKYMFFSYEDGEFILRGELSSDIDYEKNNSFERALYIGDYVYAVSGTHFISADIETMSQTDEAYFD